MFAELHSSTIASDPIFQLVSIQGTHFHVFRRRVIRPLLIVDVKAQTPMQHWVIRIGSSLVRIQHETTRVGIEPIMIVGIVVGS